VAGPLEDGEAAYQRGDYLTAVSLWRPLADYGDATAQVKLGQMYEEGHGVPQSYAEAIRLYRLAAEKGNAFAQDLLGLMYEEGEGVPQDLSRRSGCTGSLLGEMYGQGHGVPQDYAEAVKWYRLAAEQGNAIGQFDLGTVYVLGKGVAQDLVQSRMWFDLAAAQGVDQALKYRDEVARSMTPAEIAQARRLASEWKPKGRTTSDGRRSPN
jgi:TPR repeat protein